MKKENKFLRCGLKYGVWLLASIIGADSCYNFYRHAKDRERQEATRQDSNAERRTDGIYEIIDRHDEKNRDFYRAVVRVESSDNPRAVSRAGARGLMQIMEGTWKDMTNLPYEAAFEPEQNVEVGVRYLNWIADYIEKSMGSEGWERLSSEERKRLVLAGYNGGVGRLRKNEWKIEKMPQETRNYVEKVMEEYGRLGGQK